MFRKRLLLLFFFSLCFFAIDCSWLLAQDVQTLDSSAIVISNKLSINFSGAHYYQTFLGSEQYSAPSFPLTPRSDNPQLQNSWGINGVNVTDNPLRHGASYAKIDLNYFPIENAKLDLGLIGEVRGISYGVRDVRNMTVFPQIQLSYLPSISIGQEKLDFKVAVGDFINQRVDEGLTIYKMDWQGSILQVGWRDVFISYTTVGDAGEGIGLNLDQAEQLSVGVKDAELSSAIRGSLTAALWRYLALYDTPLSSQYYSISANVKYENNLKVYFQLGIRNPSSFESIFNGRYVPHDNNLGLVLGINSKGEEGSFHWDGTLEYRYYGNGFNAWQIGNNVYYRDTTNNGRNLQYANSIGDYLYPLYYLERPFSQWAVFTEYQGENVQGLTLQLKTKYFIYDKVFVQANLDINTLIPQFSEVFTYPFFDIGFGWEPVRNTSITFSLTNRAMNLDKNYPTYYLYTKPVMNVAFRFNIP